MDDNERRRTNRRDAFIAVSINTPTRRGRFGMTRNVSKNGMLIGTASRFRIGEQAWLTFRSDKRSVHNLRGRIVRLEVNDSAETPIWHYLMAVRLADPLPETTIKRLDTAPY
jgi:hypothetical protein